VSPPIRSADQLCSRMGPDTAAVGPDDGRPASGLPNRKLPPQLCLSRDEKAIVPLNRCPLGRHLAGRFTGVSGTAVGEEEVAVKSQVGGGLMRRRDFVPSRRVGPLHGLGRSRRSSMERDSR